MVDTQHFCLRWNNYQSSITSAFENLRDDEDFVDVTLACDGRSLKAHRVVLSACSPYFRELLKVRFIIKLSSWWLSVWNLNFPHNMTFDTNFPIAKNSACLWISQLRSQWDHFSLTIFFSLLHYFFSFLFVVRRNELEIENEDERYTC